MNYKNFQLVPFWNRLKESKADKKIIKLINKKLVEKH